MTQDLKKAGQVVAFRFPQTDLEKGKLRPALLLQHCRMNMTIG